MQRLKTRPQFQATMAGGTVARTAHFALHRLALDAGSAALSALVAPGISVDKSTDIPSVPSLFHRTDEAWLGAMVPKRWARRAVTRNAIKRQIYNVATGFEPELLQAAHVVRLRVAFDRKQFVSASSDLLKQAVRAELLQLFERATAPRKKWSPGSGVQP